MLYSIHRHRRLCCFILALILAISFCIRPHAVALAAAPIAVAATSAVAAILIAAGLSKSGDGFNTLVNDIISSLRLSLPQLFTPAGLLLGFLMDGKSYFSQELVSEVLVEAGELGAFSVSDSFSAIIPNIDPHYSIPLQFLMVSDGFSFYDGRFYNRVQFAVNTDQPVYFTSFKNSNATRWLIFSKANFAVKYGYDATSGYPYSHSRYTSDGIFYVRMDNAIEADANLPILNTYDGSNFGPTYLPGSFYSAASADGLSGVVNNGAYDAAKPLDEQVNDSITRWLQQQAVIDSAGTDVAALPLSVADSYPDAVAQDQAVAQGGYISVGTAQAGIAAAEQAASDADFAETLGVFEAVQSFALEHIAPALAPLLDRFPLSIPYDFYLIVSALGGSVPDGLSGVSALDPNEVSVDSPGVAALADEDDYTYTASLDLPFMTEPIIIDLDFTEWLPLYGLCKVMFGLYWTALLLRWAAGKEVS